MAAAGPFVRDISNCAHGDARARIAQSCAVRRRSRTRVHAVEHVPSTDCKAAWIGLSAPTHPVHEHL
jgi:hypothetical protein